MPCTSRGGRARQTLPTDRTSSRPFVQGDGAIRWPVPRLVRADTGTRTRGREFAVHPDDASPLTGICR